MRATLLVSTICVFALVGSTQAIDLKYGADTLPYLASEADVIVKVVEPERGKTRTSTVAAYRVTVREAVKGEAAAGERLWILVPSGIDLADAKKLAGGLLFLRGPVERAEASKLGVGTDERSFWLVSGEHGALGGQASDALPEGDVRRYLELANTEAKLEWAQEQLKKKDEYLQRSAMFELAEPELAKNPRSVEILGESVKSDIVLELNKETAVQLLQKSGSRRALEVLREVAIDEKTSPQLRESAIQAMPGLPGANNVLKDLAEKGPPLVRPTAADVVKVLKLEPVSGPEPRAVNKLEEMLRSDRSKERSQAFAELGRLGASDDSLKVLKIVFSEQLPGGTTDKLRAVHQAGRFGTLESVKLLQSVAADKSQPDIVRSEAVLEISNQPAGISLDAMEQLSTSLEAGAIKDLTTSLTTQ